MRRGAVFEAAGWTLLGLAGLGAVYAVAAAEITARKLAERDPEGGAAPAVTLLKPLHGAHPRLREDLESFLGQDYRAPVQLLFGLQRDDDPARAVVDALIAAHPGRDVALVVDPRLHGANRKVSNLINLAAHARHEVLVLSDGDIRVAPDYLRRVAGALQQPGVGAVTCLYTGRQAAGVWSQLSALGVDQHFLPNVCFGLAAGMAKPCFGSTIALRRETLAAIGGFEAFADLLADDYEIGRAVRGLGLSVAVPSLLVEHAATETTARELFAHELRWSRTIRRIDPAGHAGAAVTNPLPLALVGAVIAGLSPAALAAAAAVLAARLHLARRVGAATGRPPAPLWMTPVRDIASFIVYLASFGGDSVVWGRERFRTDSRGTLRPPAP